MCSDLINCLRYDNTFFRQGVVAPIDQVRTDYICLTCFHFKNFLFPSAKWLNVSITCVIVSYSRSEAHVYIFDLITDAVAYFT